MTQQQKPLRINIDDQAVDIDLDQRLTYHGQPFSGEAIESSPEGVTIATVSYADGYEDGPHLQWYYDGTPKTEGMVRRNLPVGTWKRWHPNGQLAEEARYTDTGDLAAKKQWDESGAEVSQ